MLGHCCEGRKQGRVCSFPSQRDKGNIGFEEQKVLLDDLAAMIPEGVKVMLSVDRFYRHHKLIRYCQEKDWSYRIRLKGNLTLKHEGGELSVGGILQLTSHGVENAELFDSGVFTSIRALHEEDHEESWFIAIDGKPTVGKVMDYGMR